MLPSRRFVLAASLLALLITSAVLIIPALDIVRAAALVVRAADLRGAGLAALRSATRPAYRIADTHVPARAVPLRARMYLPDHPVTRGLILTAGVHAQGIDEPRLVKLARDLASTGIPVLTPE